MARDLNELNQMIAHYKQSSERFKTTIDSIIDKYGKQEEEELDSVINLSKFHVLKDTKGKFDRVQTFGKSKLVSANYHETSRLGAPYLDASLYAGGKYEDNLEDGDFLVLKAGFQAGGENEPSDAETLSSHSSDSDDTVYSDFEGETADSDILSNPSGTDSRSHELEVVINSDSDSVDEQEAQFDETDGGYHGNVDLAGYHGNVDHAGQRNGDKIQKVQVETKRLDETFVIEDKQLHDKHRLDRNHDNSNHMHNDMNYRSNQFENEAIVIKDMRTSEQNHRKKILDLNTYGNLVLNNSKEINNNSIGQNVCDLADLDKRKYEVSNDVEYQQRNNGQASIYRDGHLTKDKLGDCHRVPWQLSKFKNTKCDNNIVSESPGREVRNKVRYGKDIDTVEKLKMSAHQSSKGDHFGKNVDAHAESTTKNSQISMRNQTSPILRKVHSYNGSVISKPKLSEISPFKSPPNQRKVNSQTVMGLEYSSPQCQGKTHRSFSANDLTPSRRRQATGELHENQIYLNDSASFKPDSLTVSDRHYVEHARLEKNIKAVECRPANQRLNELNIRKQHHEERGTSKEHLSKVDNIPHVEYARDEYGLRDNDDPHTEHSRKDNPTFFNTPLHYRQARGLYQESITGSPMSTKENETLQTSAYWDQSSKKDSGISTFHDENLSAELATERNTEMLSVNNLKTFNKSFSENFSFANVSLNQSECQPLISRENDDKVMIWLNEVKVNPGHELESSLDQKFDGIFNDYRKEYKHDVLQDKVEIKVSQDLLKTVEGFDKQMNCRNNSYQNEEGNFFGKKFSPTRGKGQNSIVSCPPLQRSPLKNSFQKSQRHIPFQRYSKQTYSQKSQKPICSDNKFRNTRHSDNETLIRKDLAKPKFEERVIKRGSRTSAIAETFQRLKKAQIAEAMAKFSREDGYSPPGHTSMKQVYTNSTSRRESSIGKRYAEELVDDDDDEENVLCKKNNVMVSSRSKSRKIDNMSYGHNVLMSPNGKERKREMNIQKSGMSYTPDTDRRQRYASGEERVDEQKELASFVRESSRNHGCQENQHETYVHNLNRIQKHVQPGQRCAARVSPRRYENVDVNYIMHDNPNAKESSCKENRPVKYVCDSDIQKTNAMYQSRNSVQKQRVLTSPIERERSHKKTDRSHSGNRHGHDSHDGYVQHDTFQASATLSDNEIGSENSGSVNRSYKESCGGYATDQWVRNHHENVRDTENTETRCMDRNESYSGEEYDYIQEQTTVRSDEAVRTLPNESCKVKSRDNLTYVIGNRMVENEAILPKFQIKGDRNIYKGRENRMGEKVIDSQKLQIHSKRKTVANNDRGHKVVETEKDSPKLHRNRNERNRMLEYEIESPKVSKSTSVTDDRFQSPRLHRDSNRGYGNGKVNEYQSPAIRRGRNVNHDEGNQFSPSTDMAKLKLNTPKSRAIEMQVKRALVRDQSREGNDEQEYGDGPTAYMHYQNKSDGGSISKKYDRTKADSSLTGGHTDTNCENDSVEEYFSDEEEILEDHAGFISLDKLSSSSKPLRIQTLNLQQTQPVNIEHPNNGMSRKNQDHFTLHENASSKLESETIRSSSQGYTQNHKNNYFTDQKRNDEGNTQQTFQRNSEINSNIVKGIRIAGEENPKPKIKKSLFSVNSEKENDINICNEVQKPENCCPKEQPQRVKNKQFHKISSRPVEEFKMPMSPPVTARSRHMTPKDGKKEAVQSSLKGSGGVKNTVKSKNFHGFQAQLKTNNSSQLTAIQYMQSTPIRPGAQFMLNETISTILGNETENENETEDEILLVEL